MTTAQGTTSSGKGNRIERVIGKGGLPMMCLWHSSGYSVVVSEYGAHIVSWMTPDERELLFLSDAAVFEEGKAIRGGIPIVFPQFSKQGPLPAHGVARTKRWKVVREQVSDNDAVSVTLRLNSDRQTETVWPHQFTLEFEIVLTDVLLTTLRVHNTGETPFSFTSALHTYFRTSDVSRVSIQGLSGAMFLDFLKNRESSVETRGEISIHEPIDRVYVNSPETVAIASGSDGVRYLVTKDGFADSVVWNPWIEGARTIADLRPEDYQQMVCVESGNVDAAITLAPGATHSAGQIIRAQRL